MFLPFVPVTSNLLIKYRLDKHWSNQDLLFDFNADLTGTGIVPVCLSA